MQIAGLAVLILPEVWYGLTGEDTDPVLSWWLGVLLLARRYRRPLLRPE